MAGIDKHLLCAKILGAIPGATQHLKCNFHLPWVFNLRRETFWDALTEMTAGWRVGGRGEGSSLVNSRGWNQQKTSSLPECTETLNGLPSSHLERTAAPRCHSILLTRELSGLFPTTDTEASNTSSLQTIHLSQNFLELSLIYLFPAPLSRDNVNPFKATYIVLPQTRCITQP